MNNRKRFYELCFGVCALSGSWLAVFGMIALLKDFHPIARFAYLYSVGVAGAYSIMLVGLIVAVIRFPDYALYLKHRHGALLLTIVGFLVMVCLGG